jgi:hypothetical protein
MNPHSTLSTIGEKFQRVQMYINPEQVDDPIALKTQWEPLRDGSYIIFGSHYLVFANDEKAHLRPTISSYIIQSICVLGFFTGGLMTLFYLKVSLPLTILGSALFFFATYYLGKNIYKYKSKIIFDKTSGTLQFKHIFTGANIQPPLPLKAIYAVQLLYIYDDDPSDVTTEYYEFNLVLKNAQRVNILALGSKKRTLKYAKNISEFLNIPVWDMTNIAQK